MLLKAIVYSFIFSLCFADFDESLLFCKNLPSRPTNGLIRRDRVSFYKGQGYIGSMDYMCLPGFDLIGKQSVTCENGIWTDMPQCIPKRRCAPIKSYPANTIIVSDNITLFQNDPQQIIVGSTVHLQCADNYELDPSSFGSLNLQCQNDGSWPTLPNCSYTQGMCDYSKLYLPAHSRITRMNFTFSETNRQLHLVGSHLEYGCEEGYRLHDGKTSLIVECLSSGSWSTLPVCEYVYEVERPVRCAYPIYIKNGFITLYNVTIWEDQSYTGRVVYECNYGFETFDGEDQIVSDCVNGTWTNVVNCQEISTCPKEALLEIESEVRNSYIHNVSLHYIRDPQTFVHNSYVLRTCLPNFEHDPSSPPLKIQCRGDTNTWTGVPICRAMTTATTITVQTTATKSGTIPIENDNSLLPMKLNTDPFETMTTVEQAESGNLSFLTNSSSTSIKTTAQVAATEEKKMSVESDNLLLLMNTSFIQLETVTPITTTDDNEIAIQNDNLSSLMNSTAARSETMTTVVTMMEKENSTVKYEMTPATVCHSNGIPNIPNAIVNLSQVNETYDLGATLYYACQSDYESVLNQTSFTICSLDGTWSLTNIDTGICQLKTSTTTTDKVVSDPIVTTSLNENSPWMNISDETLLPSTRSISNANRHIRQIVSHCKEFPQIEHAQLLSDGTIKYNSTDEVSYTGSVTFVCQYGFLSDVSDNEPFQLTCQNGAFHPRVTCIEKPRCSLPPPIDAARSTVIDSLINVFDTSTEEAIPGSYVLLNCFDKTKDETTTFNLTCLENGQWTTRPSLCTTPFKRRCQMGITVPNARTRIHAKLTHDGFYDDGSRASYQCLENFVHDPQSGPLQIQCRNGRWGPRPRCTPSGCLEPLPDTIENGWKSAESYVTHSDITYYLLTRYSCHGNALMVGSSTRVIDIACRKGQWDYEKLPECQLPE